MALCSNLSGAPLLIALCGMLLEEPLAATLHTSSYKPLRTTDGVQVLIQKQENPHFGTGLDQTAVLRYQIGNELEQNQIKRTGFEFKRWYVNPTEPTLTARTLKCISIKRAFQMLSSTVRIPPNPNNRKQLQKN